MLLSYPLNFQRSSQEETCSLRYFPSIFREVLKAKGELELLLLSSNDPRGRFNVRNYGIKGPY